MQVITQNIDYKISQKQARLFAIQVSKDSFEEIQQERIKERKFTGALTIARLYLAKICGESENFTVDEIADTYGISREKVIQWAERKGVLNNITFVNLQKDGD